MTPKSRSIKTGCRLHNDCFDCPLPLSDCPLENVVTGKSGHEMKQYKERSMELKRQGYSVKEIADKIGKSKRSVGRYIKEYLKSA